MTQQDINSQSMLRVGTVLRGIYRIDSYLSSGGFGNTYVATNIEFEERVAIKEFFMKGIAQRDNNQTTVSVSNAENQNSFLEQREKFKKEARRLRQLNNPHIVKVHDLFEENGTAYYVMDYVDGENLSDRLKRTGRPITESEVNQILPQILDALKSVHDTGIWHLDLKPANIMVDKSGQVKLIDFGASKQLNAQKGGATTSTAISYTNGYAPREQMEQNYDKFGPWTDLYALGATLYNLLANKRPPRPSDIDDDMSEDKHLALPMPNVSEKTKLMILWMLQTNRNKRPQHVSDIKENLVSSSPQIGMPIEKSATELECTTSMEDEKTLVNPIKKEVVCAEIDENTIFADEPENILSGYIDNQEIRDIFIVIGCLFALLLIGLFVYNCSNTDESSTYYPTGSIIEIDELDIDETASEKSELSATQSTKIYDIVEEMPQFPGGPSALFEFLNNNATYPIEAEKRGIEGRVIVTFVVECDGSVTNVKVVKSVDPLLDEEATRVVSSIPKWIPGKQDGNPVRVKYTVPMTFKLE